MILTEEEYSRGFIDFDAELPEGCQIDLWTETADDPEQTGEWKGPYSMPSGCKVLSLNKRYLRLRVELKRGDNPSVTPVLDRVRWERDGATFIWSGIEGFDGPPAVRILGRDFGCSYRMVFAPRKALWPEPFVLIDKQIRIRFSKGQAKGYEITGFEDEVPTAEGAFSFEGEIKEVTKEGDFVEVLATIPTENETAGKEAAKIQIESIAGLLALCLGDQILGEVVFEDYFFSNTPAEQGEVSIPVKHQATKIVSLESVSVLNDSLERYRRSPLNNAIALALRWYAKAIAYEAPIDRFIACFIGLDALTNGYFASLDPEPTREEYDHLEKYFEKARPSIDNKLRDIALGRLTDFPLTLKFSLYWEHHFNKETMLGSKFPQLNRLRGELLHGKARLVTQEQMNDTRKILEKLLGRELGLDTLIEDGHTRPKVLEATLRYVVQTGKPDGG